VGRPLSEFSFSSRRNQLKADEGAVEDGGEQGVQLSGGSLGLQAFHFTRKDVFGEGSLIVRPGTTNTPSP
jgi:hypothetical protein